VQDSVTLSSSTKRGPTQGDVARLADVSQATVSYVLNNKPSVALSVETRERILEAARQLGYVPNGAARALRTRKTMTIASIIPDITNPFYPWFERGIQDVAESHGYELIVYNTDGREDRERTALESVRRSQVDGLIMTVWYQDQTLLRQTIESGVKIVMLAPPSEMFTRLGIDSVCTSNEGAAEAAINHLLDLGHTRIAMIAGEYGTPPRERRIAGYRAAMAKHHIAVEDRLIRAGDFSEEGGYASAMELLAVSPRPTAIFAANDLMAIGAMRALREAGLSIPGDIALVGFDNIPAASLVHPGLTTVEQFPHALGKTCAQLLMDRLNGGAFGPARHVDAPVELIIRDST
jgi:LacI family transcriptional regulator